MNKWVQESIRLANSQGYLDKLFDIYPTSGSEFRNLPEEIKLEIIDNYNNKNKFLLIKSLLKLKKFPIDDPYVASLRKHNELLEKNPATVERIGKKLLSMTVKDLIQASSKPKSPSRQFGHAFKDWLNTLGYPFEQENKFEVVNEITLLSGSDLVLKN